MNPKTGDGKDYLTSPHTSATRSGGASIERINEYLQLGGLFNPELMDHDKVRDLLIDIRNHLTENQTK